MAKAGGPNFTHLRRILKTGDHFTVDNSGPGLALSDLGTISLFDAEGQECIARRSAPEGSVT